MKNSSRKSDTLRKWSKIQYQQMFALPHIHIYLREHCFLECFIFNSAKSEMFCGIDKDKNGGKKPELWENYRKRMWKNQFFETSFHNVYTYALIHYSILSATVVCFVVFIVIFSSFLNKGGCENRSANFRSCRERNNPHLWYNIERHEKYSWAIHVLCWNVIFERIVCNKVFASYLFNCNQNSTISF